MNTQAQAWDLEHDEEPNLFNAFDDATMDMDPDEAVDLFLSILPPDQKQTAPNGEEK